MSRDSETLLCAAATQLPARLVHRAWICGRRRGGGRLNPKHWHSFNGALTLEPCLTFVPVCTSLYLPCSSRSTYNATLYTQNPIQIPGSRQTDRSLFAQSVYLRYRYHLMKLRTLAVAESGPSTPFGRGSGGCIDVVSTNYSVSASTDM